MQLPDSFLEFLNSHDEFNGLADALMHTDPSVSVRVNQLKGMNVPANATPVPWAKECGYYIDGPRPRFTFMPQLHQGLFYVQDASSMAIREAVKQIAESIDFSINYLDACAAPGGKTTCAIDALPGNAVVVANEYDYHRASVLAENVMKWGSARTVVSRGDTSRFRKLEGMFHVIAADVPCSGEGMMRKDAKAVEQWSPALVSECAARQCEIIDNLWAALAPGGYLIYSTCTFNREENEEMLQHIIDTYGAEPVVIDSLTRFDEIVGGIDTTIPCYRFIPGRVRGEGLFMGVLRKPGTIKPFGAKTAKSKPAKSNRVKLSSPFVDALSGDFVLQADDNERLYAVPSDMQPILQQLLTRLDVIHYGVQLATIKGRDQVPHQSLALSHCLKEDVFPRIDVDHDSAIDFLRRQSLQLPADTPRGFVLLTHDGHPLGFAKNLGNRANNLYPEHWKILSAPR